MIQSSRSATPSSCASAWPSSTWKPGGSPALLAKGSELGWAHRPIVPTSRMVASGRASASPSNAMKPPMRKMIVFIACRPAAKRAMSASTRLQVPDIDDDRVDLLVVEARTESRHRALLAVLDAVAKEVVVMLVTHQLRPLAGFAAA